MPSLRSLVGALVAALALTLVAGASAAAGPDLTRSLKAGGLVVVFRHAATDFSKPDQDPVVVSDCSTQRNLSAQGRADARAIGRGVRRLGLPVGNVFSSAYCRTLETARLAFGRATVHPALLNTIAAEHDAAWRSADPRRATALRHKPAAGKLTVLVTHGVVVQETSGQTLEEGEAIVFRPLGNSRFRVVGRVMPQEWGDAAPTGLDGSRRPQRPGVPGSRRHAPPRRGARTRRDGLVHGAAHRQAGTARPEDGTDDGDPARGGLGAARRHRRPRRRRMGDRRRAERDRPGRPGTSAFRGFRLPASTGNANLNTATFDKRGILWFTGPERHLRPPEPEDGRDAGLPRAARRRAVRDHDDPEGPRLLRLARG